jgi:hypothetical protein
MTYTISDYERLNARQASEVLGIPYQTFNAEVQAGVWDGCYVYTDTKLMKGDLRFIPKKCFEKLDELAEKTAQHAKQERAKRRKAA